MRDLSAQLSRRTLLGTGLSALALPMFAAGPPSQPKVFAQPAAGLLHSPVCTASSGISYPPPLERFLAKLDPASDVFIAERYTAEIEQLLALWTDALCASDPVVAAAPPSVVSSIDAGSWNFLQTGLPRASGSLHIIRGSFPGARTQGRDVFLSGLQQYLTSLQTLRVAECEIFGASIHGESPLTLETEIRYDLVGVNRQGLREQRTGSWTVTWTQDSNQQWLASKWTIGEEVRSTLKGPGFTDITAQCLTQNSTGMAQLQPGIDHWRSVIDTASGIDVYGNHGIAVGDIDGSGFDSFYVCQPSGLPNRLYRNRGDGTFEDITEESGTGLLDGTASALFADFLNRGKQDLLVVRTGGPLLFANEGGGKFVLRPDAFQFVHPPQGAFTSAAIADYDRDGYLDIYFCVYSYYQGLNQYQFPSPYYDAQNGPPNFLFHNRRDGTFEDVTARCGLNENNNRFSFAAEWCDYDNDGWPDLYVANDFGRKNLYRSNGDGTFTDVAGQAGVEDYGPGMSTCWVDYDNDGHQDLYVANMWLSQGKRITADPQFLPSAPPEVRAIYQLHNRGNSLYRNTGNGKFEDRTLMAGTAMGRWSWSCANWDFDQDGFADLYVANGFVSGPNHQDLQSFFWRQVAQRSFSPEEQGDYDMAWNAVNELVRSDYSWSGYQRNVLYANHRDGTFSDASGVLGLDFIDDSRAFALSDFDHDGCLEFALKNRTGPQLRIVKNELEGLGGSVVFRLQGTASNRDAIGASITIESGAPRQTRFISAGSGFASQHTKELLFGIGPAKTPLSIAVRWPDGNSQRFDQIPINHRVHIQEGVSTFTVQPFRTSSRTTGSSISTPPAAPSAGTWLTSPLFGPDIQLPGIDGKIYSLSDHRGAPLLVTFFRTGCPESESQLKQWQQSRDALSSAAISIVALAVNGASDLATLRAFSLSERITFPILLADDRTAGAWNIQYRYLFDRRREMPLPASFLLDDNGAIVRVYPDRVAASAVVTDWASAPRTNQERLAKALPFAGPYHGPALLHNYFTYGIAFVQYGYLDEAANAFQRAIDSNPKQANAWFNLGTIYLNRKDYPKAKKYLTEAVHLDPTDAQAWNNLGMVSGEQQDYAEAVQSFRQAARCDPNYLLAVQNMVRIYEFQNRPADAQKDIQDLIARAPRSADLHQGLAMTLVAQNEIPRARDELEIAVNLRPSDPNILNNLGVVLLRAGDTKEALQRFDEARRAAPDFDRPYLNAAVLLKNAGQPELARQWLSEFLKRHPDNTAVRSAFQNLAAQ